jgi:endonuclease/exonuclease/phosphatase family metal-dependent hydrolase
MGGREFVHVLTLRWEWLANAGSRFIQRVMNLTPLLVRATALCLLLAGTRPGFAQVRQVLPASDPTRGELRVVTYNILGGRGTDNARDLGRVADVLRALNADLISLQEVDVLTRRNGNQDIPAELSRRLGMEVQFAQAIPHDGGKYGVAVLSGLPVHARAAHKLPTLPGHEVRAVAEVVVELPGLTNRVAFLGTHLDHTADNATRRLQIAELVRLAGPAHRDAVLAGDLNMEPGFPEFTDLLAAWKPTWPDGKAGATWPAHQPTERIDHVLTRGAATWRVRRVITGPEAFPADAAWQELLRKTSDHLPVLAELTLEPAKP